MKDEVVNKNRREFLGVSALAFSCALTGGPAMTTTAFAAGYRKNPFTLVYAGTITKNEPGKVNIHPVTYKSMAWILSPTSTPRQTTIRRRNTLRSSWRIRMAG